MPNRLLIWSLKTLFCIVDCTVCKVEFEIRDVMRDMTGKLLKIVL
jgi:hypothetical protein